MRIRPALAATSVSEARAQAGALRGRAVALSLAGVVPITLFVQWSDLVVGGTMAAGPFPPLAAMLLWGVLFAANRLTGRRGAPTLHRSELLLILAVWITVNMVVGRGLLHPALCSLAGPTYYARSGAVVRAIAEHLPPWLALTDPAAARGFFEGHGLTVPWSLWLRPLCAWALFFFPFLTANLCLCALFEPVWSRQERLAFPLVALPLEALSGRERPLRARASFYFGVAVPLLLHGFGAAHAYVPAIPCIPFFNDVSYAVTELPWSALRPLYVNFYPLLVGLTFLAPADVTFGIWFFLALNKIEMLATAAGGWNDGASVGGTTAVFPYIEEQSAGAFLMLGGVLLWNARRHWRNATQPEVRGAAWGFGASVCGVLAWCAWAGFPLWFAMGYFGFVLIVALVLGRLMAEGGVSWILAPILPDKLLLSLTGSNAVSPLVLTRLMLHVQHLRDTRQMFLPALLQAGKLREEAGVSVGRFYLLLLVALVLALGIGVATALPIFYQHGALSLMPNSDGLQMSGQVIPTTAVTQASARLLSPVKPNFGAWGAVGVGAFVTFALSALRLRYFWFPLHPLGYAMTGTLQLGYANKMLFSIFLGWLFKSLTLRFGGTQGFQLLRQVALGLIFGDLLIGGVLKLLDALLGPSGYAIF